MSALHADGTLANFCEKNGGCGALVESLTTLFAYCGEWKFRRILCEECYAATPYLSHGVDKRCIATVKRKHASLVKTLPL